ncbi:MAG: SCO family protein [Shewanella sp.]|nr:SCO family protein [Shewanella sp.]
MSTSFRTKLTFSTGLITVVLLALITVSFMYANVSPSAHQLLRSATLLEHPRTLTSFTLVDHHNKPFTQADLEGKWHLLAYGFLNCADICPTTLMLLNRLQLRLQAEEQYQDIHLLFYTIDPGRDTVERLAEYVPFFGANIIGLKAGEAELANGASKRFEHELGIRAKIETTRGEQDSYKVSHGVALYLIDPQGRLHAVFKPSVDPFGISHFNHEDLYHDYVLIRKLA